MPSPAFQPNRITFAYCCSPVIGCGLSMSTYGGPGGFDGPGVGGATDSSSPHPRKQAAHNPAANSMRIFDVISKLGDPWKTTGDRWTPHVIDTGWNNVISFQQHHLPRDTLLTGNEPIDVDALEETLAPRASSPFQSMLCGPGPSLSSPTSRVTSRPETS